MEIGIHELTAGYALDALELEERHAYEQHLAACAQCKEDLASFWEVTGALALAATGPEPPPELRERIVAAARAETQTVVPLRGRSYTSRQAFIAVVAIAAVALVAIGWWAISLRNNLTDTRSALSAQRTVAEVLADGGARQVPLAVGRGTLVDGSAGAVLVVDGLSSAPAGQTYQVWVLRKGKAPSPSGLFTGGRHSIVLVRHDVANGDVVAVTLERTGGAKTPTTTPIVISPTV